MPLPALLMLTSSRNQLEKGRMERMCTSRIYGHQMKKLQRLSNCACCLICSRAPMKQSHRETQCGTSCLFQKQTDSHGTPIPPTFMILRSSRI
uniref:Uncharacterized protein n=1 Tax=Arundo donax TaxID=35708 RepID=A0A0A8Z2F8_ARUDO